MSFGDFENLGEKNKRGSVDLDIFTAGVSTVLCNGNALTLSRLPQFPGLTIGDFASQNHKQPIFATSSSDALLLKFFFSRNQARFCLCIHQSIQNIVDVGDFIDHWDIMEPVADKIVRLELELQALEDREKAGEKGLSDRIAAKERRLNIYLESQRGKFASPISVVVSHSYR